MKVRDIKEEYLALNALIQEQAEEFDPETGEFIDNTEVINNLVAGLKGKRDSLVDFLADKNTEMKASKDALAAEIKRLQDRKASYDNASKRLLDTIDYVLEGQKTKTELHTFYYQNTKSVEIISMDDIPADYIDFKPAVNKTALKKALTAGVEVKGALIKETIGIRIR